MNNMKDFKDIADDIMRDIRVREELKEKTLIKCANKRSVKFKKRLISAACFILVLGLSTTSYIIKLKSNDGEDMNNINMITSENIEITPEKSSSSIINYNEEVKEWTMESINKVREGFGIFFIMPNYIPEGYKLEVINTSGINESNISKVELSYYLENNSFIISQQKSKVERNFSNYKEIDINGITGLLKIDKSLEGGINTEIHWRDNGINYSIEGLVTEEEVIKIAKSMK